jgi:hypothetical protein
MSDKPVCPKCQCQEVRKHGQHLGKQRWFCKKCGLAFTGGIYDRHRPEEEARPVKLQNRQLLRLLNVAVSMRKAQRAYLLKPCAKTLSPKLRREEKFDKLVKKFLQLQQPAPEKTNEPAPKKTRKPVIKENKPADPPEQGSLFKIRRRATEKKM